MRYSFDDAGAAERHETQYFEMFCNRGIYDRGWTAVTRHSTPWVFVELPPFADDTWELYDTNTDWSQARDLAAEMPEKLEELKALFMEEARKYNVLPLDDRRVQRFNSDLAGSPVLIRDKSQLLFSGMGRLTENAVINIKNKSHSVTAEIQVPEGERRGDHRSGRRLRGLEPLRQERSPEVLLQPVRPAALLCRGRDGNTARRAPGAAGVRL
jgi:arylsulfatase